MLKPEYSETETESREKNYFNVMEVEAMLVERSRSMTLEVLEFKPDLRNTEYEVCARGVPCQ